MMIREESGVGEDFINAKVRGMRSKLFESDRLLALAECPNLPELFRRISPLVPFEGHRAFERELLAREVRELDLVSQYLSGRMFHLFQWLMIQYQLDNLKVALRVRLAGMTRRDAEELSVPVPSHLELPLEKLFDSASPAQFAASLPVEEFRPVLAQAAEQWPPDLFALEMSLDRAYCAKLAAICAKTKGWVRRLVGYDVDLRNLLMLLRGKLTYSRTFDEMRPFLALSGTHLTERAAEELCSADDLEGIVSRIPVAMLSADIRSKTGSLRQLEDALRLNQYRLAVRCFAESVLNVAVTVAYFYIKRAEFMNLVRLTQGIRHSLPQEEIKAGLLLPAR